MIGLYSDILGIVGGFGAYATLEFYRELLEEFATDCDRNYPHMIFDNNFTLPSRTLALLYGKNREEVVQGIADSIKNLLSLKCSYVVLVCGTAHGFLKEVYEIIPEAEKKIINIIDITGKKLLEENIKNVSIIAAEGMLYTDIYGKHFSKIGITSESPDESFYPVIRSFMEAVKQNRITKQTIKEFLSFLDHFNSNNIILGCTEFPVLIKYIMDNGSDNDIHYLTRYNFLNPMNLTIKYLKEIMH